MKLFISYSSTDRKIAFRLADFLKENQIDYWIDQKRGAIKNSSYYAEEIDKAFSQCTGAIFLITPHSQISEEVKKELNLANALFPHGFSMFELLLDGTEHMDGFRYQFSGKEYTQWNGVDIGPLEKLKQDILLYTLANNNQITANLLKQGIRHFFNVLKSHRTTPIHREILPLVCSVETPDTYLPLYDAIRSLWKHQDNNALLIGKSGCGKTVSLQTLLYDFCRENPESLGFYVRIDLCAKYNGKNKILQYIQKNYVYDANLFLPLEKLRRHISCPDKESAHTTDSSVPNILIVLDGLSNFSDAALADLQQEIDYFRVHPNIQLLLAATSDAQPFELGTTSKQRFEFQELQQDQIDTYLESTSGLTSHSSGIPYRILSTPLMLSIYSKTKPYTSENPACFQPKIRKEIHSEADVLWNYLEIVALEQAQHRHLEHSPLKISYFFRITLPHIARYMQENNYHYITIRALFQCMTESLRLFENDTFLDLYEEYFGEEEKISFEKAGCRKFVFDYLIKYTGIFCKLESGHYGFSSSILQNFFAAVYYYRHLCLQNKQHKPAKSFEKKLFSYETCKFLGELCLEQKNTPYYEAQSKRWIAPHRATPLTKGLEHYRRLSHFGARQAVANLIMAMKISRNNDLSGVDLSHLDLRRCTFSYVTCSHQNANDTIAACFDFCHMDQWCFHTVGYSQDLASVCRISDRSFITTTGGQQAALFEKDEEGWQLSRIFEPEGSFIQSLAISSDGTSLLFSDLTEGITECDMTNPAFPPITLHIKNEDVTMFHQAKYLDDSNILYITKDKKLFGINRFTGETKRLMDINGNAFTVSDPETVLITSRSRELIEYDPSQRSIRQIYTAFGFADSFLMKGVLADHNQYVLACSKDGKILQWDHLEPVPQKIWDLGDPVNDILLNADHSVLYCLTEQDGIYCINRREDSEENCFRIPLPEGNHWACFSWINETEIAVSSVEGSIIIFHTDSLHLWWLCISETAYHIPGVHLSGCSFRHLPVDTLGDSELMQLLKKQEVLLR